MNTPRFAKDLMITKLVTLTPEIDVLDAIQRLLKNQISGAPVIDEQGNYLGVFSEGCCMSVLVEAAYHQLPSNEVRAFMDTSSRTIDEETDLLSIIQIFLTTKQRRLPVLRERKLVGQISRRDVLRSAMKLIERAPDREKPLLYLSALRERADAPIA